MRPAWADRRDEIEKLEQDLRDRGVLILTLNEPGIGMIRDFIIGGRRVRKTYRSDVGLRAGLRAMWARNNEKGGEQ